MIQSQDHNLNFPEQTLVFSWTITWFGIRLVVTMGAGHDLLALNSFIWLYKSMIGCNRGRVIKCLFEIDLWRAIRAGAAQLSFSP